MGRGQGVLLDGIDSLGSMKREGMGEDAKGVDIAALLQEGRELIVRLLSSFELVFMLIYDCRTKDSPPPPSPSSSAPSTPLHLANPPPYASVPSSPLPTVVSTSLPLLQKLAGRQES